MAFVIQYLVWSTIVQSRSRVLVIPLFLVKKYAPICPRKNSCGPKQIPTGCWFLELEVVVHNKIDHSVFQGFRYIPSPRATVCYSRHDQVKMENETYQAFRGAPQKEKDERTSVKFVTACIVVFSCSCSKKRRPSNVAGCGKTFGFWDCASTGMATRLPGGMMPPLGSVKRCFTFRWTVNPSGGCSRETSVRKLSRSGIFFIGSSGCSIIASLISVRRESMYAG